MHHPPRGNRPVGTTTRGTTNANRLRRIDRWLAGRSAPLIGAADDPLVVDLGFGHSPVTTLEMHARLAAVRPDVDVVGLEIDPERVAASLPFQRPGIRFALGGFELGAACLGARRPILVRAANVLRQYDESEVPSAWALVTDRLAPRGLLVDATCDEIGRRAVWVAVGRSGPVSLTISVRLAGLEFPSQVAERLPKSLIHHNVPGQPVHAYLAALDDAWARKAPLATFGARQRWLSACRAMLDARWPLLDGPARWRLGEITVDYAAVAPSR